MSRDWRNDIQDWSEDRFEQAIREAFDRISHAMADGNRSAEVDQRAYVLALLEERDRRYPQPAT